MTIMPDDKDWTWVLTRRCPDCGFDPRAFVATQAAARVLAGAAAWPAVLARAAVAVRPAPDIWSALEYAAHVRDVLSLFRSRLALMLERDDPVYASWDQDAVAVGERYGEQDPAAVAAGLQNAAAAFAGALDAVPPSAWQRTGRRTDGKSFTVETLAKYALHDLTHHLWDVRLRR
jgi:hypothetical protein